MTHPAESSPSHALATPQSAARDCAQPRAVAVAALGRAERGAAVTLSALHAQHGVESAVILVEHGCADDAVETVEPLCRAEAAESPGRVTHLRLGSVSRASAWRAGIEAALTRHPGTEAALLLASGDAPPRTALRKGLEALEGDKVHWIAEDSADAAALMISGAALRDGLRPPEARDDEAASALAAEARRRLGPAARIPGVTRRNRASAPRPVPTAPRRRASSPEIGFVLHRAGFGGTERVAYRLAERLKAAGMRPRLFVCGQSHEPAPDFASVFGPAERLDPTDRTKAVEALSGLNMIIASQVDAAPALFRELRARGVATAAHAHLIDRTAFGRDSGFVHAVLARMDDTDLVLTASRDIAERMAAIGAPEHKLILVANAPGFAADPAASSASLEGRLARLATGTPLRALFLGRLDWQKGLHALAGMVRATTRAGAETRVQWRIVGDEVLGGDAPSGLKRLCEPPVTATADLQALYDWGDVVVAPSLYEGAPLTILEAMRAGAIPLASAVGATPELIADGQDGVLLSPARALSNGLSALAMLNADRAQAARMARAAHARMIGRDWDAAAADAIAAIRRVLDAPEARR